MFRIAIAALAAASLVSSAYAMDGMIRLPSAHAPHASLDRLEALARERGMKVFVRIDHAAGARSIGQDMRPTELIVFGSPKGGTPLMLCAQTYGIDLPLRVLAWQDEKGANWLGYVDLATLGHALKGSECETARDRLTATLDELVRGAAKP